MSLLRNSAGCGFPYEMQTVCYIEVGPNGSVKTTGSKQELIEAITRLGNGWTKLYAVWPGKWSSDLFEIDYDEIAEAFGIATKQLPMPQGQLTRLRYLVSGPPGKFDECVRQVERRPNYKLLERGPYHLLIEGSVLRPFDFHIDITDGLTGSWSIQTIRPNDDGLFPDMEPPQPLASYRTKTKDKEPVVRFAH